MRSETMAGFFAALVLALGLMVAGLLIGRSMVESRLADRTVTVRGLAERDVKADLAMWPIKFTASGNSLTDLQADIEAQTVRARTYLLELGFEADGITPLKLAIQDNGTGYGGQRPAERYQLTQTLLVRSNDVDRVTEASRKTGEFVKRGVIIFQDWEAQGATYVFTGLNEIKPEMIAEATKDARAAAEQFAADSGAALGGIKTAQQGYFSIDGRDVIPGEGEAQQAYKKVRVVTTVTFSLE
jgi:uncharacterized protein